MTTSPESTQRITRFKYSLQRKDIMAWHIYVMFHNRFLIGFLVVVNSILFLINLRATEVAGRTIGFKLIYSLTATLMLTCFAIAGTMLVMFLMVATKKFRGVLGEHELDIQEEGLVERTEFNQTVHRWKGFHKIVSTRKHLYIYVTDNNAHVVPRRCFSSVTEEQMFRSELEKNFAKARS